MKDLTNVEVTSAVIGAWKEEIGAEGVKDFFEEILNPEILFEVPVSTLYNWDKGTGKIFHAVGWANEYWERLEKAAENGKDFARAKRNRVITADIMLANRPGYSGFYNESDLSVTAQLAIGRAKAQND